MNISNRTNWLLKLLNFLLLENHVHFICWLSGFVWTTLVGTFCWKYIINSVKRRQLQCAFEYDSHVKQRTNENRYKFVLARSCAISLNWRHCQGSNSKFYNVLRKQADIKQKLYCVIKAWERQSFVYSHRRHPNTRNERRCEDYSRVGASTVRLALVNWDWRQTVLSLFVCWVISADWLVSEIYVRHRRLHCLGKGL